MDRKNYLRKNMGGAILDVLSVCMIFIIIIAAASIFLQSTLSYNILHFAIAKKHGNRITNETITDQLKPNTNSSDSVFLTYTPQFGLTIQYPANWEKVIYGKAIRSGQEGPLVNFLSPLDSSLDKFRDYLLIRLINASDSNLKRHNMNLTVSNVPLFVANYSQEDPANSNDVLKTIRFWTDSGNGKVLVFEFTAEGTSYSKYLPIVARIIGSLRMHVFE